MRQTRDVDGFGDAETGDAAGFLRDQTAVDGLPGRDAGLFGGGEFVLICEAAGCRRGSVEKQMAAALAPDADDGHALDAL